MIYYDWFMRRFEEDYIDDPDEHVCDKFKKNKKDSP